MERGRDRWSHKHMTWTIGRTHVDGGQPMNEWHVPPDSALLLLSFFFSFHFGDEDDQLGPITQSAKSQKATDWTRFLCFLPHLSLLCLVVISILFPPSPTFLFPTFPLLSFSEIISQKSVHKSSLLPHTRLISVSSWILLSCNEDRVRVFD